MCRALPISYSKHHAVGGNARDGAFAHLTSGHNSVVQEVQQSLGNHGGQTMELNPAEGDLFAAYLSSFTPLAGDRRTASLLGETVRGIIASESLCCARIAAFSPWVGGDAAR
jgi:hypothetical protein